MITDKKVIFEMAAVTNEVANTDGASNVQEGHIRGAKNWTNVV